MKKIYKLSIAIGAPTVVAGMVIPITIVFTQKSNKKLPSPQVDSPTPNPTQKIITPEKYTIDISNVPKQLSMFSFDTLTSEAKELKDTNEWVGGIEYHAASSAIAFLRNLAESYGYSTKVNPKTNKTARQDFLERNHCVWMDDKQALKTLQDPNSAPDVNLGVAGVKVKSTIFSAQQKRKVLLSIGKDGGMANDKDDSLNTSSGHLENYNLESPNAAFGSNQFTVYPDYRTPGIANVELYSAPLDEGNAIIRQVNVPNIIDPYPILSEQKLKEYAPLMKYMLGKFLSIYQGNEDAAMDLAHIAPEICDQVNFLVIQNLTPNAEVDEDGNKAWTLKIDDEDFLKHLRELNNGSTHWLAIKTILCGLDATFASKDLILFTGDRSWPSVGIEPKTGIKDMDSILALSQWGGQGRLKFSLAADAQNLALIKIDEKHSYPATFVAGKTVDELYAINGISLQKREDVAKEVNTFYTSKGY